MRSKWIGMPGVLLVLTILPALAQVTSTPNTPKPEVVIAPHQMLPMRFHQARLDGTVESENWSGYVVTGFSFTVANGSWTVPAVNCNQTPNTYAAFWVGIDGYSSGTVEQTGTLAECNGTTASYFAWYEFYPNPVFEILSVPVSPGNQISASVTYDGSGLFTTTITNQTTGNSYSTSEQVRGARRSSAEWIVEAPCCTNSGDILPLAAFGTADLGQDYTSVSGTNDATNSSTSGAISAFASNSATNSWTSGGFGGNGASNSWNSGGFGANGASNRGNSRAFGSFGTNLQELIMVSSSGVEEAVPSTLSSDGTSFTVTWDSE